MAAWTPTNDENNICFHLLRYAPCPMRYAIFYLIDRFSIRAPALVRLIEPNLDLGCRLFAWNLGNQWFRNVPLPQNNFLSGANV